MAFFSDCIGRLAPAAILKLSCLPEQTLIKVGENSSHLDWSHRCVPFGIQVMLPLPQPGMVAFERLKEKRLTINCMDEAPLPPFLASESWHHQFLGLYTPI